MAIRLLKPVTSASRKTSYDDFSSLDRVKPTKSLTKKLKRSVGRDSNGRISIRHKGGGSKRKYRVINFRHLEGKWTVLSIEYDPNRTAFIALIQNENNLKNYIIATSAMKVGSVIDSKNKAIEDGKRMFLKDIPTGVNIHNIEIKPGSKAKMVRSAGTSTIIMAKEGEYATLKLPSGELRKFHINCLASIGTVSNSTHNTIRIGKAGRVRHMGIRPTVRGKAMSPNSHPHGGGEGNTSIGLKYPKTPWGKHALGKKTRKINKYSNGLIVKRRK